MTHELFYYMFSFLQEDAQFAQLREQPAHPPRLWSFHRLRMASATTRPSADNTIISPILLSLLFFVFVGNLIAFAENQIQQCCKYSHSQHCEDAENSFACCQTCKIQNGHPRSRCRRQRPILHQKGTAPTRADTLDSAG